MLTADQILTNWNRFRTILKTEFKGTRLAKLEAMYDKYEERIAMMPASTRAYHHSSFEGGYISHVLRVYDNALLTDRLWSAAGAKPSYTREELVFAALNHDLGKVGSDAEPQYIPQDSEWHRKNQGQNYKMNPLNPFMIVSDRSLFILQEWGIAVSTNEYLGIKLHDGLYEEENKSYYISFTPESRLRTNLPYVLHQADLLAARLEFEEQYASKQVWYDPKNVKATTLQTTLPKKNSNHFAKLLQTK